MWKYVAIILGLLYVISPLDLLPDWFIGWGWLDDLVIVGFLARFFLQNLAKSKASTLGTGTGTTQDQTDPEAPDRAWDPYRVLELEQSATKSEIRQAYRRLANQYHPDKVDHLGREFKALAEAKFKDIQRAYEELQRG